VKNPQRKISLNQETLRYLVERTEFFGTTPLCQPNSQISNCTGPCPPSVPADACV